MLFTFGSSVLCVRVVVKVLLLGRQNRRHLRRSSFPSIRVLVRVAVGNPSVSGRLRVLRSRALLVLRPVSALGAEPGCESFDGVVVIGVVIAVPVAGHSVY